MDKKQQTITVIGNGMVGHRFVEKLVEFDTHQQYKIVTFCEEPRAAYDRVGLTSFFAHRDAEQLMIARLEWYRENGVELHIGDRANAIDRDRRVVTSDGGVDIQYDQVEVKLLEAVQCLFAVLRLDYLTSGLDEQ